MRLVREVELQGAGQARPGRAHSLCISLRGGRSDGGHAARQHPCGPRAWQQHAHRSSSGVPVSAALTDAPSANITAVLELSASADEASEIIRSVRLDPRPPAAAAGAA